MKKESVYADLHSHSTASDGMFSPRELVKRAKNVGLKVIALTDHDTVTGINEAVEAGKLEGITVVPGIEISCGWEDREASVHVLGLFIDINNSDLIHMLDEQQKSRFIRADKMLDRLEERGMDMSELRERFHADPDRVLGRPHVARFLLEKGIVKTQQEAFERFLLPGRPAYIPKSKVDPLLGVKLIHKAGGLAVIAHPGLTSQWPSVWERLKDAPWDGIEVYYAEHSNGTVRKFKELADEFGLVATGGSDYHGEIGKHAGRLGKYGLSEDQFKLVLDRISK